MAGTMELIATTTLAANQATVTFSSITNAYTDLRLLSSARTDRGNTGDSIWMYFNGDTASGNYSNRILYGSGSAATSITAADAIFLTQGACGASDTANTFGNSDAYISNYAGNTNKSVSHSGNSERDATTSYMSVDAGLWSSTAEITSITLKPGNGTNFVAGSTFYLYGIRSASATPGRFVTATGGVETIVGGYKYHTFTSSGVFTVNEPGWVDYIVVGGGGASGHVTSGGGGAGGVLTGSSLLWSSQYVVGVGGGGGPNNSFGNPGSDGTSSFFGERTTFGGGGGGGVNTPTGRNGGSGGGAAHRTGSILTNGGSGTSGQGTSGGNGSQTTGVAYAGGGGGANTAGGTGSGTTGGNGGAGISWGGSTYGGGGGGWGSTVAGTGGAGGGGAANASTAGGAVGTAGAANTGGGGGGSGDLGTSGGSGVVIIRYPV